MLIIIDTNEKATNPEIVKRVKEYFPKTKIMNLPCGDVNIPLDDGEMLAIERKTPNDFLRSVRDGEIFHQIETMSAIAKYYAIVVTGFIQLEKGTIEIDGKGMDWEGKPILWTSASIDNLFTVIQWSGCALKFCSPEFYPVEIERLYNVANKPSERSQLRQRRIVTFPPLDDRVQILAQVPGIGIKRARGLLIFAEHGYVEEKEWDDFEYSTLAKAVEFGMTLSMVEKDLRPPDWGPKTILGFRKFWGVNGDEYLKVEKEK